MPATVAVPRSNLRRWLGAAILVPLGSWGQDAPDISNDFAVRLLAGSSDNIQRRTIAASGEYRAIGFVVDMDRQGPRLDATISGDVDFREYSDETIPNERVGSLNARLGIDIVPGIFTWEIGESYGQGRRDPFRTAGPTNRQEINIFSTGPRVSVPLGSRSFLDIQATAARRRFDSTGNLDSDEDNTVLGLSRLINPVTQVGLGLERRKITYENSPLLSWEVEVAFLSYDRQLASGSASVRVGENKVDFGQRDASSPLVELTWNRRVGARTTVTVSGRENQLDPGDGFLRANVVNNIAAVGGGNAFLAPGVYENIDLSLTTSIAYARMGVSFALGAAEDTYASNPGFDNEHDRVSFRLTRFISDRTTIALGGNLIKRRFVALEREDIDRNLQLSLVSTFGRRMSLDFSYQRWSRDTQTGLLPFEESIYQVAFVIDLNP